MKPAPFEYVRATSLDHALSCLERADAKLIAGGQSLLPLMNLRLARADLLVDVDGLGELARVVDTGEELVLGALVRHDRLARDPLVADRLPLLAEAARHIGHVGIRNRGSLGGSLAHADPTAELPAACCCLGARVVCDRADGRRRELAADDFFRGIYQTALEPGEMITWVRFPVPCAATGWGFCEVAPREGDFAWAGACCTLDPGAGERALHVVVFGVEAAPRSFAATGSEAADEDLADRWAGALRPTDDAAFRRDLAAECIRRAVRDARGRAGQHG